MIEKGDIYRSCDPREGASRQIRITSYRPGEAKAHIVSHPDGKRFRQILVKALHESDTTRDGEKRRNGYVLVRKGGSQN